MTGLTTTLHLLLEQGDGHFRDGRIPSARSLFEELLERSQERTDRGMEVVARSMLAQCQLRRRDFDGAREELEQAALRLDGAPREAQARYRAALARLATAQGPADIAKREVRAYLAWAEGAGAWREAVDACLLLGDAAPMDERAAWLQRGIDVALDHDIDAPLGRAYNDLASILDELGRLEEALEAYQHALTWHRRNGSPRQVAGASWAVGVMACRLEDWPLALACLESAVLTSEASQDCADLLALALADLARVHDASGDVIEARRVMLRALGMAREQDLPKLWPERWGTMLEHARRLDLER
jgi:tetratricopeptide (TPR) repeat protein